MNDNFSGGKVYKIHSLPFHKQLLEAYKNCKKRTT